MPPIVIVVVFFGVLAVMIGVAVGAGSRRARVVAGVVAFGWAMLMFSAAGMVESFNLNIWYSTAARKLLDATMAGIDAGKGGEVSRELKAMRDELEVTYEHRGNFKELAEETTARLETLGKTAGRRDAGRREVR